MSIIKCKMCGGNIEVAADKAYGTCDSCGSHTALPMVRSKQVSSTISLQSDIDVLLQKCKNEPWNARKYANRILDIDPSNREAQKYL